MDLAHLLDLLAAAIRIATPLIFAALGGILSERAGVFAVGLEGMMLSGACGAAIGTVLFGTPVAGLVAAALLGALLAAAIAVVAVRHGADNMVTGIAANILAVGLTSFLTRSLLGSHGAAPRIRLDLLASWRIPGLAGLPEVGPLLFDQPLLTYAALLAPLPLTVLLDRTRWGLTLRATGENPTAVFALGGNPVTIRFAAVSACGGIAGLGGAVQMLPYLLALAVLVGLGRSAQLPAAIGTVFRREPK